MGMLSEANVEVVYLDGPFNAPYVVRRNGQNINL
jgi:Fe2+ transport system protein FeoA